MAKIKIKKQKIVEIVIAAFYNDYDFSIEGYPDGSVSSVDGEEIKKFVKSNL